MPRLSASKVYPKSFAWCQNQMLLVYWREFAQTWAKLKYTSECHKGRPKSGLFGCFRAFVNKNNKCLMWRACNELQLKFCVLTRFCLQVAFPTAAFPALWAAADRWICWRAVALPLPTKPSSADQSTAPDWGRRTASSFDSRHLKAPSIQKKKKPNFKLPYQKRL